MAIKLDLLIELDSKGAVAGVKALNSEIGKTEKTTNQAEKGTEGLFGSIFKGVTIANLATKGMDFLGKEFSSCFTEAMNAERIQSRLNTTLKQHGESVEYAGALWEDFAMQMAGATGTEDDQVKSLVALAFNLGIASEKVDDVVRGAIGLTEIFGGSLESNTEAVSRAYQGNWRQIDMMIPEIKKLSTESEKMAALQQKMADGFDASSDAMKSATGAIILAKNDWNNFKESVGNAFLTLFSAAKKFSDFVTNQGYLYKRLKALHDQEIVNLEVEAATHKKYMDIVLEEDPSEDFAAGALARAEAIRQLSEKMEDAATKSKAWAEAHKPLQFGMDSLWKRMDLMPGALEQGETAGEAWVAQLKKMEEESLAAEESHRALMEALDQKNFDAAINGFMDLADVIGSLNGPFGDVIGFSTQMVGSFNQMKSAANFGEMLSGISGVVGGIIGVAKVIGSLFPDAVKKAIEAQNEWMDLDDEFVEKIKKVAMEIASTTEEMKKFGDAGNYITNIIQKGIAKSYDVVHWATSKMLDEIIRGTDITLEGFDNFAIRVREILADYDEGMATAVEIQREIGDSFEALMEKAIELGTEGSNSLITLFEDLAGRGLNVAEVNKYINEQLQAGLEGYKKYLEGDFSTATIGVYESLLAYEKKVEENQALVNGIQGITQALIGLSNTTRLTEEEFDKFEMAADDAFSKLIDQGFTSREALTQLAPMLARMAFLQSEYGLTIDASTQALIDKAKAENINLENYKSQEEIFGEMSASLKDLVNIFKNAFPQAISKTTDAFKDLNDEAEEFNQYDETIKPPKKRPPGKSAAIGYYSPSLAADTIIQAHEGEEVIINKKGSPAVHGSRGLPGGGMPINIYGTWNINVSPKSGIDSQDLVDGLAIVVKDNLRGITDEIYTAMARRMN